MKSGKDLCFMFLFAIFRVYCTQNLPGKIQWIVMCVYSTNQW